MRVLNTLPQADLRSTAASAIASEAAGYDGLLTMENKHDPFLAHAIAAVNTERVELGTSVAIAFARSPMVVANASWDLQNASRGRFVLGTGPQIRHLHGFCPRRYIEEMIIPRIREGMART